ncbi:MAG TPA: hypothetical protein VHW64_08155 [Nocardioides sp.]|uniref:hypothetical protein n=1 Tax=Nocardioides sp. TaxID=35761 RepID=UPI002E32C922|nr:hypothetical protein [Nocardioides sp.]HEX3930661.1 hypothetical protein [Nocardioides sp.]
MRRLGAGPTGPRSVGLALRAAWGLVALVALVTALMAIFYDDVVGAWADRRVGAREAFAQGGRVGLERAGFAPPHFLPVAATMLVVGAMIVWVLGVFLRLGYRWGQLGLFALMLGCAYASISLGLVLGPPPVFRVAAVVTLLVEGVAVVCLWHRDTLAHVHGPWRGGPGLEPTGAEVGQVSGQVPGQVTGQVPGLSGPPPPPA